MGNQKNQKKRKTKKEISLIKKKAISKRGLFKKKKPIDPTVLIEEYSQRNTGCSWDVHCGDGAWDGLLPGYKRLQASTIHSVLHGHPLEKHRGSSTGRESEVKGILRGILPKGCYLEEATLCFEVFPFISGWVDFIVQEEDGSFVMVEAKGLISNSRWELTEEFKDLWPELCQLFLYSYLTGMKDCVLVWGE